MCTVSDQIQRKLHRPTLHTQETCSSGWLSNTLCDFEYIGSQVPNYRLWNSLSTGDELNVWLQLSTLNTSPPLSCCLFLGLAVWGLVGQHPQLRHPRCYGQVKILTFSPVWNTQSMTHSSGITQKTDCLTQEKDRTTIEFNITSSWTQHPVFYTLQINNILNKYERSQNNKQCPLVH